MQSKQGLNKHVSAQRPFDSTTQTHDTSSMYSIDVTAKQTPRINPHSSPERDIILNNTNDIKRIVGIIRKGASDGLPGSSPLTFFPFLLPFFLISFFLCQQEFLAKSSRMQDQRSSVRCSA